MTNKVGIRCIDTRGGYLTLNLENSKLETGEGLINGNQSQPLTVGGNHKNYININIKNSTIDAGSATNAPGYAIAVFNPVNLNIDNSKVSGYTSIYLTLVSSNGANGSNIKVNNSTLKGVNLWSTNASNFATIVIDEPNISIELIDSKLIAEAKGTDCQSVISNSSSYATDTKVSILGNDGCVELIDSYAKIIDEGSPNNNNIVEISGGYFTADPTDYIVKGKYADKITQIISGTTYNYKVESIPNDVEVKITNSAPTISITTDEKPQEAIDAMNSAAASMSSKPAIVTGLNNPTSSIANDLNTSDIVNHASGELGVSLDKINIFLQSYIDIVILDAQTDSTNISTLTVDIKPMTKTIATTATKINDIVTDDNINKNAVQFGDSQILNITTPVTITLPVPTNFSTTNLLVNIANLTEIFFIIMQMQA